MLVNIIIDLTSILRICKKKKLIDCWMSFSFIN